MLKQEDDPYLDEEWLTYDERSARFIKYREHIVGKSIRAEMPSVQGHKSSEEDLVIRERVPIKTEIKQDNNTGNNGIHATIVQVHNDGYSYNMQ